jgi:ABC-2 type transport system ATP-binding protein
MIEIQHLAFAYRRSPLFQGLDLVLEPGNIYGLLGLNGAGKSTLLKLMAGLLFADRGSLRTLGYDPARRDPALLSQVFLLPEDAQVPHLTGRQYVRARAPFYSDFDHAQLERHLSEFELPQGELLTSLSHGQQRKFLLSFGLACQAALVLLDEPTNGLDISSKGLFRRAVAEAATERRVFVISTHQVRDVGVLIDPIVILHQGRVLFKRSLSEIGSRIRMMHSASPPERGAPGLLFSEPAVGGFWSVWQDDGSTAGTLDLEVLFNALIAQPEIGTSVFGPARAAS